jgi:hypothetical protein
MWDSLTFLGLLVALGYLIRVLAKAVRESGLEEFILIKVRFRSNEKPPKQLDK